MFVYLNERSCGIHVARNRVGQFRGRRVFKSYNWSNCLTCDGFSRKLLLRIGKYGRRPVDGGETSVSKLCVVAIKHLPLPSSNIQTSFPRSFLRKGKRRKSRRTREESGTRREALFPVGGVRIGGPNVRARNGRLKEVLLRDKPEVIRLPRGKLSFLPAGFFVGLRPPTNIHSRLTPLFTVCGCLSGFLPLIGIFYVALFTVALFFRYFPHRTLTVRADEYLLREVARELFWYNSTKQTMHLPFRYSTLNISSRCKSSDVHGKILNISRPEYKKSSKTNRPFLFLSIITFYFNASFRTMG